MNPTQARPAMIIDPSDGDRRIGRVMLGLIVPRPVAWVSTLSPEGIANLAPYSFFNGISGRPPVVGFSASRRKDGTRKDSAQNALLSGEFVVNMCDVALGERMVATSWDFPQGVDEFEHCGIRKAASEEVMVPRVADAPASLECRTLDVLDPPRTGMSFVLGEVVRIHVRDDLISEDWSIDLEAYDPLARLSGPWYAKLHDRFELPRHQEEPPRQVPPSGE